MKIQKTFTIEKELYISFDKLSKIKSLNKSLFVENCIREYIEKNKKDK
jgi:metal-responsive CopG/Arc/MetJ family transcriptional regulator